MRIPNTLKSSIVRPGVAAAVFFLVSNGFAADGTWNVNANGNWSDAGNWSGGNVADGATFTAFFDAALTGDRVITLDSARTIGNLNFLDNNGGGQRFTLSGANTLTLNANGSGGGTSLVHVSAGTAASIGGSSLILAGSSNIEKTGAGSLTLSTSNALGSGGPGLRAFTGTMSVSAGTLRLGAQNPLAGVPLTLGGGADNVVFSLAGGIGDGQTYNTGGITVASGAGTVTFDFNGSGERQIIGGNLTLNRAATMSVNPGILQFNSTISGAGGLVKTGGGTLQLNSSNTFSGGVDLRNGTIRLVNAGGLGTGTLNIGDATTGGTLLLGSNGGTTSNNIHVVAGTGSVTINSLLAEGQAGPKTLSGNIQIDRNISFSSNGRTEANAIVTATGVISGVGAISASSHANNRVEFTGNNTYSGGTTIAAGTVRTGNANALGTGQVNFHASNTATLQLNNSALTVQSLAGGSSASTIATGGTNGILTISGGNVSAASFAGVISGSGSLVKNGAGTQILSGNSTYTGPTMVSFGTLLVNGNNSAATGTITLANGATLGGAGTVGAAIGSAGTIAPGDGTTDIGTLNGTNLTLDSGSNFQFDLGSGNASDLLALSGAFTLGTGTTFNFDFNDTGIAGNTYTLLTFGSLAGGFTAGDVSNFTYTGLANGVVGTFALSGTELTFATVPEPGTWTLLAFAGTFVIAMRRRR